MNVLQPVAPDTSAATASDPLSQCHWGLVGALNRAVLGGDNRNAPLTWRCGNRKRDDLLVCKTIRMAPDGRGGKTARANKHRDEACHESVLVADGFD